MEILWSFEGRHIIAFNLRLETCNFFPTLTVTLSIEKWRNMQQYIKPAVIELFKGSVLFLTSYYLFLYKHDFSTKLSKGITQPFNARLGSLTVIWTILHITHA